MRFLNENGHWIPTLGGIQCPCYESLFVELYLATALGGGGEDFIYTFGQEEGLWVRMGHVNDPAMDRPVISVRIALWVPTGGWMAVSMKSPSSWTTGTEYSPLCGDAGYAIGHLAFGGPPPDGVSPWLADLLSDPAALILALQVMGS